MPRDSRPRSRSPYRRENNGSYNDRRRSPPTGRPRDNGYASRGRGGYEGSSSRGRGGPDAEGGGGGGRGYSERDRERERESDRKRYDGEVKKERRDDVGPLLYIATRDLTPEYRQDEDREPSIEPEKPNFGNSGLLAKETNTVKGVQLKYNEPPEARKPLKNWRLYVFKGKEQVDLIHIYKQSAYLVGRDTVVTDIPIAHPSCSKQHAAIQYRQITEKNEFGDSTTTIKPFIIDLDSTNGTHVNDQEIPKSRYYELRNSDVLKFGTSSREYVLLHEEAA